MFERLRRIVRYQYLKLLRIKDDPAKVAKGFAVGIAVGALPCMGIQTIVALPVVLLLRGNFLATAVGVWWTNPLTAIPVYYFEYKLGVLLTGCKQISYRKFVTVITHVTENPSELLTMGHNILVPLFWGGLLVAIVLFPIAYRVSYNILERRRIAKHKKEARKLKKNRTG
jgi:uncharacterized protein (DUF2062 family)